MKILGIIPASKGSKRLPNKNILHFDGKPLNRLLILLENPI
jgi:CMP-N-acetylneuraminic acid synthetase